MRLWHIHLGYLDNKRLMAQHNECHALHRLIMIGAGGRWSGVVKKYENSLGYVRAIHNAALAEMVKRRPRKVNHKSPLLETIEDLNTYYPTEQDLRKDITQLRTKWEREGYYFGVGRLDLRDLETRLGIEPGRDPKEIEMLQVETTKIYKGNLNWFNENRHLGKIGDRLTAWRRDHQI